MSSLLSSVASFIAPNDDGSILDNGGIYYFNETNVTIVMNGLPPAPVIWMNTILDTICSILSYCVHWRGYFSFISGRSSIASSWFSTEYIVPSISSYKPMLLTFQQYQAQQPQLDATNTTSGTTSGILSYLSSWYRYAFETDSTALGELTTVTALCTVLLCVLPLLRLVKSLLIPLFCSMGYQAALQTHGAEWITQNQIRISKFGEYVFRLSYHSLISIYGLYCFQNSVWWSSSLEVFRGYPNHPISPSMAWYYLLQTSYNLDALITLVQMSFTIHIRSIIVQQHHRNRTTFRSREKSHTSTWLQFPVLIRWSPNVRGDCQEMFIHHIITNALVIFSSMLRLTRIGSMVFLIHDISDVPVDMSKLANFLKWKIITLVCFGSMSLTWLYTRLYILPMKIFYTSITQSHYVLEHGTLPVLEYVCYRHILYVLLVLLILLHAAWFAMFVRMFITILVKKEIHDYSEHKNGEPPSLSTTSNTKNITTVETKKKL